MNKEIVDILSGTVDFSLLVKLKTPNRSGVISAPRKTTQILPRHQLPLIKSGHQKNYLVQYSHMIQNFKKSNRQCLLVYYCVCYFSSLLQIVISHLDSIEHAFESHKKH